MSSIKWNGFEEDYSKSDRIKKKYYKSKSRRKSKKLKKFNKQSDYRRRAPTKNKK